MLGYSITLNWNYRLNRFGDFIQKTVIFNCIRKLIYNLYIRKIMVRISLFMGITLLFCQKSSKSCVNIKKSTWSFKKSAFQSQNSIHSNLFIGTFYMWTLITLDFCKYTSTSCSLINKSCIMVTQTMLQKNIPLDSCSPKYILMTFLLNFQIINEFKLKKVSLL